MSELDGPSAIPAAVRIRVALNNMGMKFADDGKPSLIINKNPIPLGTVTMWEDQEYFSIRHYKQVLPVPQGHENG